MDFLRSRCVSFSILSRSEISVDYGSWKKFFEEWSRLGHFRRTIARAEGLDTTTHTFHSEDPSMVASSIYPHIVELYSLSICSLMVYFMFLFPLVSTVKKWIRTIKIFLFGKSNSKAKKGIPNLLIYA